MLKKVNGVVVSGFAAATAFIGNAHAAVPTEVTTAMADGKSDALVVAGLAIVIVIAIAAFKYMKKAL